MKIIIDSQARLWIGMIRGLAWFDPSTETFASYHRDEAESRSLPDDYVISTGESHSVRELVEIAFGHVGLDWQTYVRLDPKFLRPAEVDLLVGDSSKARKSLGWAPEVDFTSLVRMMVDADLARLSRVPGTAGIETR